jgi:hypothetical protein
MPTQLISIGPPTPIVANVNYALPATACILMANNAITTSTDGTTFTAHTSGQLSAAAFVKTAVAGTVVTCKRQ